MDLKSFYQSRSWQRHWKRQIRSSYLPATTAEPAVYIISGTIPIEGTIHKRALTFYGNLCRVDSSSVEQLLAGRPLSSKTMQSNSWFVAVRKIMQKYELPDPLQPLRSPPPNTHDMLQITGKSMATVYTRYGINHHCIRAYNSYQRAIMPAANLMH